MTLAPDPARETTEARLRQRVAAAGLVPLWSFFKEWFAAEPNPAAIPHVWRYADLRPVIMEAGAVVSTAEAERRVLVLENPGLSGRHLATDALYAGLQLILPGEFARTHRHTAAALRFIVEGENTYTAVAGERCYMRPGDFIVTPSWAWHEHRNEGQEPTIWLDVLDVPLIRFLGAGFSEHYPEPTYPTAVPPGDSHFRYGRNLLPVGFRRGTGASPVFAYPFDYAYEALEHLRAHSDWDACHGIKMEYIDPDDGRACHPDHLDLPATAAARFRNGALSHHGEQRRDGRPWARPRDDRPRRRAANVRVRTEGSPGRAELAIAQHCRHGGIRAVLRVGRSRAPHARRLARATRLVNIRNHRVAERFRGRV